MRSLGYEEGNEEILGKKLTIRKQWQREKFDDLSSFNRSIKRIIMIGENKVLVLLYEFNVMKRMTRISLENFAKRFLR